MTADDKQAPPETGLTVWRRSYAQLRLLERQLVAASRAGEDPARLESLYQQIEAVRAATTELFTAAQLESVSHHVHLFRTSSSARREMQQQLLLLPPTPAVEPAACDAPPPMRSQAPQRPRRAAATAAGPRPLAVPASAARHAP